MRAEQLTDPIAFHGEGPVWSPSWGGLRWVDMLAGDILTLRRDRVERRHVGDVAAAVRPRSRGGAVIGREGRCHARGRDRLDRNRLEPPRAPRILTRRSKTAHP